MNRRSVEIILTAMFGIFGYEKIKVRPTVLTSSTEEDSVADMPEVQIEKYITHIIEDLELSNEGPVTLCFDNMSSIITIIYKYHKKS